MDPHSAFTWQADTLLNNLAGEATKLDQIAQNHPHAPFARSLSKEMRTLSQDVQNLINDTPPGEGVPQQRFSSLRRRTGNLVSEALAVHLVGFLRDTNLDSGMCAIADGLLKELSRAVAFELPQLTTVAESEFFGVPSRIVRLRYPCQSMWDLPVLAHEFAHLFGPFWFAPANIRPYPQRAFLDKGRLGNRKISEEYFCDLMATFLMGPAYVYTCLVLRFDPTNTEDEDTHPSDAARAEWVLKSLELLAAAVPDRDLRGEYRRSAEELRRFWDCYVSESKASKTAVPDVMNDAAEELFADAQSSLWPAAYADPSVAWGLKQKFDKGRTGSLGEGELRHLLNACWFARRNDMAGADKAQLIDTWARETAEEL